MRAIDDLDRIVAVVREEVLKEFHADSCIASVKILSEVLDYFGHSSEPLPVIVCVFNAPAFQSLTAGIPMEDWPEEAWSVGITGTGESKEKRWDGHLVAMVDGKWLVDPSLDQASRPARNITMSPVVLDATEWNEHDRKDTWSWQRADGVTLMYKLMPKPGMWRNAPDWTSKRESARRRVVGSAIRRLKKQP